MPWTQCPSVKSNKASAVYVEMDVPTPALLMAPFCNMSAKYLSTCDFHEQGTTEFLIC